MAAPAVTSEPGAPGDEPEPRPPRRWLPPLGRAVAAVCGGLLLFAAGPPRPTWFLAPLGFAVLGLVLREQRARAGFGYALLFGAGYFTPLLVWTGEFVGVVAWLPLAGAEAVFVGLSGMAIVLARGGPIVAALLWVAGEALRSVFPFGGFPWGNVAFGQPEGLYLPLAAVGGVPLIGFAVALTGFGLAELLHRAVVERSRRVVVPVLCTVLPILAGVAAASLVGTDAQDGEVTVAAIQGNVPRAGLDFNAQRRAVLDNHARRTEQLAADVQAGRVPKPDLVIWPENSSDIDPIRNRDAFLIIDRAARAIDAPITVGGVLRGDDGRPSNTMVLWDPRRGPVDFYTKRQLQPFGETMPYRSLFRIFSSDVDRAGNFAPGSEPTVFSMGGARVAMATCYEVAFDGVVRESVRNGSNLLAVPTNNATFGYTEMTYQQLAMDRVRAVEHGRTVVVAATSGVSAIVRPDGSVTRQTDLFTPAALVERVPLRSTTTLSDQFGAWPQWLMVGAGLVALVIGVAQRRNARKQSGTGAPAPQGGDE